MPVRSALNRFVKCFTLTGSSFELEYNDPAKAQFNIIWRPMPEQLKAYLPPLPERVRRDPALMLEFPQSLYLVKKWNVEGEQPFEHILKEYGEMPF